MSSRAKIRTKHETAVLQSALQEHNRHYGLSLKIVDRPDPPDAILSDGSITTWMELTNAFFSSEWAQDLFSYTSNEPHKPMRPGPYINMDVQLAENFCTLLRQKSEKPSYKPFIEKYGPGILVVGLETPWLDSTTFDAIDKEWSARGKPDISRIFNHIYLKFRKPEGSGFMKFKYN